MFISFNKKPVQDVSLLSSKYRDKHIIISIDSSKTNTAICVMTRSYKVLDLIEFNGSEEKDILKLIKEQRDAIRIIFNGSKIVSGGIEDIITKKENSNSINYHHARYVITAVFVSLICVFQDEFGITLEPIPNMSWKHAILPSELNKRSVYKGSVEYVRQKYPKFVTGQKDDDGADAICIGEFMKMRSGLKAGELEDISDDVEFSLHQFKFVLYPETTRIKQSVGVQFMYNDSLSLDLNARAIANKLKLGQLGWSILNISNVEVPYIYQYCKGNFSENTTHLMLVVKRLD